MGKIKVSFEMFYGFDCMGRSHDNNQSLCFTVSEDCADQLKMIISKNGGEPTIEKSVLEKLVAEGNQELAEIKANIEENWKTLDIQYWLDNCEDDGGAFVNSLREDLDAGTFIPSISKSEFTQKYIAENNISEDEVDECEDIIYDAYFDIIYSEYESWVNEQDLYIRADKHGLDIDACGDMSEVKYVVSVVE